LTVDLPEMLKGDCKRAIYIASLLIEVQKFKLKEEK
jgi:hypothetical protein